ncbi:MAG: hypothetical protein QOJ81_1338, partial [Chloroflexota bacterium]|nr:hypothetical protein [Chloroflexota bacterium]
FRQNTPAWIDARRDKIGSSDIPIITGNSPYATSLFSLWAYKTRLAEADPIDPETQELYDLGHLLEDDIAEQYEAKTGRQLQRVNRMLQHRSVTWASASLDRRSARKGERRIVEAKWVPHRHWLTEGAEPVPSYVQDQVQWQLFVTHYDVADVAVLMGSKVLVYEDIGPNDSYQDDLRYIAKWFNELVLRGTPPPLDGSESTRNALTRLHPRPVLDLIDPTAESDALADEYRIARLIAKASEKKQGQLANTLRMLLGDHAGVENDTYQISWTKNADSVKTDWEALARAQRRLFDLLADAGLGRLTLGAVAGSSELIPEGTTPLTLDQLLDALESLHTRPVEGARVLRAYFKNEETGRWT